LKQQIKSKVNNFRNCHILSACKNLQFDVSQTSGSVYSITDLLRCIIDLSDNERGQRIHIRGVNTMRWSQRMPTN